MKTSGIYKIQSKKFPKRVYIGSSSNVEYRWVAHKTLLGYARNNTNFIYV
jgi:predicted DNA-binding transcriptional regulator AlpA